MKSTTATRGSVRIVALIAIAAGIAVAAWTHRAGAAPAFYLGTDRSFGAAEVPYVNLEGPGNQPYDIRVYRVSDPERYLLEKVKDRSVRDGHDKAYGNPFTIFKSTAQQFKKDFRQVARKEFNWKTRSHLKNAAGVDFKAPRVDYPLAIPRPLEGHRLLFSFSLGKSGADWCYRRVPVPIRENGVFIVEAVSQSSTSYTLVVRSGLTFAVKQSSRESLIYAARRDTGEPVVDAAVTMFDGRGGEKIAQATTNASGTCLIGRASPQKSLIIVRKDGEYAISDPDFFAKSFYGDGGVRVFLYTERPVYRPGDTIQFKGVVRQFRDNEYRLAGGAGTVDIVTDEGDRVLTDVPVQVSGGMGTLHGSVTLPGGGAPYLGRYSLVLNYQNKSHATEFTVEAYKKPPFLVKVTTARSTFTGTAKIPVTVSARYYYGQPVAGEKVEYKVFRVPKFSFSPVGAIPHFREAREYLNTGEPSAGRELVQEGSDTLDGNGSCTITVKPKNITDDFVYSVVATVNAASATIDGSASFSVNRSAVFAQIAQANSVYEPGDKAQFTVTLVPFDSALTGSARTRLVSGLPVKAVLYSRSFARISQEAERKKIDSMKIVSDAKGTAAFTFKIPASGHYVLEVTSTDHEGEETVATALLWASGKSDSIALPFQNITIKPGRDLYSVGDDAELLILTPASGGTLLVTLEGNGILKHETVKLAGNSLKYRVRIKRDMMPNFTVSALQFANNRVYRSETKVVVPPVEQFLAVKVTPGRAVYHPGDTVTLTIETATAAGRGVPAEVSLGVVDEAIYQIREDQNPSIGTFFYHPRRNNVDTTLSSAYRFFGYAEARRLKLALQRKKVPGLAVLKGDDEAAREKFKDTAFWNAVVRTDDTGKARVTFTLAENLTTWRVTALAVTADTKVGQTTASFIARKDIMLNAGIPRYMIRGQKQVIAAHLTNLTRKPVNATIAIEAAGATPVGKRTDTLALKPGAVGKVFFTIAVPDDPDAPSARVTLRAADGALKDAVAHTIPLTYFGVKRDDVLTLYAADRSDSVKGTITLPQKYSNARVTVRVSPGMGEALRQSLEFLVDYPYGCVEQTMSRFMPVIAAKNAGFVNPRISRELPAMIQTGLRLIKQNQNSDGGFGWYGENRKSDPFMSAYVYFGLTECRRFGERVPDDIANPARRFLHEQLSRGSFSLHEKVYLLFCLSSGGKVAASMVSSVEAKSDELTPLGLALLSLTMVNQGDMAKAGALLKTAMQKSGLGAKPDQRLDVFKPADLWESDAVETAAAVLLAAVRLNLDERILENMASTLLVNRSGTAWKNSRDTAMAVIALSERMKHTRETGETAKIVVSLNGAEMTTITASPESIANDEARFESESAALKPGANVIQVKKKSGGPCFITAGIAYFDQSPSFAAVDRGVDVSRAYALVTVKRDGGGLALSTARASQFAIGDLVMVELPVRPAARDSRYLIVEDPIPPGFSFVTRDKEYYSNANQMEYDTRQVYDDRVVFFLSGPVRKATVRYFLRAEIPGTYRVLPGSSSCMYYPHIQGITTDNTLVIK